ncbi:hypothetical protein [Myxococcus sp. Y35]|uniref:hypothetical protein n=1 Tax=Pseudomyxococcus flavus TaxID=3115648 RepID=UPI003CEEC88C
MFSTQLRSTSSPVQAGKPTTLALQVRNAQGQPVPTLPLSHGKPMHLFIISKDLQRFEHLHPEPRGDEFVLEHTFDTGGDYTLFVDYARPGGSAPVERHALRVEGPPRPTAALAETSGTQHSGGLAFTLHGADAVRVGAGARLHIAVADAATGRPVDDLEPYLGAMAHFVVLSEDGQDFLHVHPLDTKAGQGVAAHAVFPRAGLYKLWVQVQRQGQVVTVPFVLRVQVGAPPQGAHPSHH